MEHSGIEFKEACLNKYLQNLYIHIDTEDV